MERKEAGRSCDRKTHDTTDDNGKHMDDRKTHDRENTNETRS